MATPTIELLKLLFLALLAVSTIVKRFFLFYLEKKTTTKNKLSNFEPKSWVNSFAKMQYGNPHHRTLSNALFDPFSSMAIVKSLFLFSV